MEKIKFCKHHGETMYSINTQKKWQCKKCSSNNVIKYRQNRKKKAIEYKGGKCQKCGYDKCVYALDFHHLEKNEKEFNISKSTTNWERLKIELDKCILVCSNCHREIHFEMGGNR